VDTKETLAAGMVMAAGRGRRMQPLSDLVPKPALPILDRPLLSFALEQVARAGVSRLVVNAWHLAEELERAVEEIRAGLHAPLAISREPELLGGAGGLALARDRGLLGEDGPVLVANGDSLLDLELKPLFELHRSRADLVTLALLPHPGSGRWSRVVLDETGRVMAIHRGRDGPTEPGAYLYTGVMIVSREALDGLPRGPGETAGRLWWPALDAGRLGGAVTRGLWREVGTPADYLEAVMDRLAGASWIHASARVDPEAMVSAAMVARGSIIAKAAVVEHAVLAGGVTVEAGAEVRDSVVLGPLTVGAGERLLGEYRVPRP